MNTRTTDESVLNERAQEPMRRRRGQARRQGDLGEAVGAGLHGRDDREGPVERSYPADRMISGRELPYIGSRFHHVELP